MGMATEETGAQETLAASHQLRHILAQSSDVATAAGSARLRALVSSRLYSQLDEYVQGHVNASYIIADLRNSDPAVRPTEPKFTSSASVAATALASVARGDLDLAKAYSALIVTSRPDVVVSLLPASSGHLGPSAALSVGMAWRCLREEQRALRMYREAARSRQFAIRVNALLLGREVAQQLSDGIVARTFQRMLDGEDLERVESVTQKRDAIRRRRRESDSSFCRLIEGER